MPGWAGVLTAASRAPAQLPPPLPCLQIHIAAWPGSSSCLRRLSRDSRRRSLARVDVLELQLGARLNLSSLPASAAAAEPGGGPDSPPDADWQPVRHMSRAITTFSAMRGSAPTPAPRRQERL